MRALALATALLVVAACDAKSNNVATREARLRTSPLATCTVDQQKACPAIQVQSCPGGQQPVIDYSSDCCAHVSCQPICESATPCPLSPAPVCPPGTKIWIGTAVEDCCPAYRCDPDGTQCDPSKPAACTLAIPVCAGNAPPVVVGQTSDCCPIYQCPCGTATSSSNPVPVSTCGCTEPTCRPGETAVCAGTDPCGGPCTCEPQQGTCTSDADCPSGQRCDVACVGWGCATGSGSANACACPAGDPACSCDPAGNCAGQTCTAQCVPVPPKCDPTSPLVACPMVQLVCPGGQQPVVAGTDPTTCCPIQKCPICPLASTQVACPMIATCKCAAQVGIDPTTCCPSYTCGASDPATGNCLQAAPSALP